jgi:hypothetical protein
MAVVADVELLAQKRAYAQWRRAHAERTWARAQHSLRRSRDVLDAAAWQIQASRLVLDHPHLRRINGASDPLPERVREALRAGTLPRLDGGRSWAGHGSGRECRVCGLRIEASQVEMEVEADDERILVHRDCLVIWHQESRQP